MESVFSHRTGWGLEPNRLSRLAAGLRETGRLQDLTVSNPTLCGFQYPRERLLQALGQAAGFEYRPQPLGLALARSAVEDYYCRRGQRLPIEQIVLTASSSEAYAHLFRLLCDSGDEVLMPSPSYPLFEMLAGIHDVRLVACPMLYDQGWQLDREGLLAGANARTRALLLVHPNNPAGCYLKADDWIWVQTLAAERGWAVVVDEVFFDYPVAPFAAVKLDFENAPALTFVLNGLSKLAALPQMKLAWIGVQGPEPERRQAVARLEVLNDLFLSVSTAVQVAAPVLFSAREQMQPQIRARVEGNLETLDGCLRELPAVERLVVEGGWCVVLRLPRIHSDDGWAERWLERGGVLVHPGHFYNFGADGYLVASLLLPAAAFRSALRAGLAVTAEELSR